MATTTETLRQIKEELLAFCASPLYEERTTNMVFPVIGEGNHHAKVMFVGEAPGKNEARTGRPFCGASGRVLDELLAHISLPRAEVYVTNVVKDRPPLNRDPKPEEIALYAPFLDRQIEAIQPKIIVTLGRFSMQYMMERLGLAAHIASISVIRGRVFDASVSYGSVKLIPMFHPAVGIYSRQSMPTLKADMETLKSLL
ncbi:hypothetical protein A3B32_03140 [Candidatus Uhrbacteria bacterium RIFCSPLOWO2_01_FULL_53_9]|uniref:Type-4 uracil-DNA glycosylase n=3 Tax=Candidatus Uhriibacteriota TaxID=1752732 RepID=A0A1F7UYN0_9BACT|nr:MAG: hypothetical protein A3C17_01365 [Candidatus Uhrbacteria bacterium RIFCSPHIGHO2_02_FULL_53_13]OGL83372.1 MAG: hypothetical protein A3B32_03140 [Candidatus Uhrbacteria bacterium RIFCSPLOWO2_01_FULL_53_9]OGL89153.1 MAG: hypothetical protein A3I45_03135 [Candidatus Uhrbacteria bacterium RIFCSPLOWO2_02_FULL_53_10]